MEYRTFSSNSSSNNVHSFLRNIAILQIFIFTNNWEATRPSCCICLTIITELNSGLVKPLELIASQVINKQILLMCVPKSTSNRDAFFPINHNYLACLHWSNCNTLVAGYWFSTINAIHEFKFNTPIYNYQGDNKSFFFSFSSDKNIHN